MPNYPPLTEPLPSPYDDRDFANMEDGIRRATRVKFLIERCKRCKIPVEAAERDCDGCFEFLQSMLSEFRGPQAPIP